MKWILLLSVLSAPGFCAAQTARTAPPQRAEVLVLGTYHMANPGHDVYNMQADDVLSLRRQQEIAELLEVLKRFRPTRIAIEADPGSRRVQREYSDYLAGKYTLTANEIDQIGYRLAKQLGHSQIYGADADGDFPLQRVMNYAKANGRSQQLQECMDGWGSMVKEEDAFLRSHTVLDTLLFMNSDSRVATDMGLYYQVAEFGDPLDYAGPDLLAAWYQRNIRIYNNIAKLADSPGERVLVIFGSGHLGWLRHDIAHNPRLKLRTLSEFAPRP
jgi:hypothetical protein